MVAEYLVRFEKEVFCILHYKIFDFYMELNPQLLKWSLDLVKEAGVEEKKPEIEKQEKSLALMKEW